METLIIDVETDRLQQIKDFLTSMNVQFRNPIALSKEKPYNPEFVAKMIQGEKDKKEGKGVKITLEDLDALWK